MWLGQAVNNKILRDEHGTRYFPQASKNITTAVAIINMMPPQTSLEGQRVMNKLRVLLEAAA